MPENILSFDENNEEFHDGADSQWDDLLESALDDTFYRLNCPDSDELVDYQEGFLAFAKQNEIKEHLTLCAYCQKDMVMLADLESVPFPLPLVPAPTPVQSTPTLSDIIEQLKQTGKRIIDAILPPAPLAPAFALRGGNSPLAETKATPIKRTYQAEEYEIRLTITPPTINQECWNLQGEIYHPAIWELSGDIHLFRDNTLAAQLTLDEDGEFIFDNLQAGQYNLLFDAPDPEDTTLRLAGFRLEWSTKELANLLLDQADNTNLPPLLESLRPHLTLELIEEFKRRVDDEMYRNASRALEIAEVAETTADFIPTSEAKGLALWARGNALTHLVSNLEALTCYQQAEAIYAKQADLIKVVRLQSNQVAVLQEIGKYQEAVTLYKKARLICETIGPPAQRYLAGLEMNIGLTYWLMGELTAALAANERSYALFASLPGGGQETRMAMIDINQANILEEMDNFSEAEPLYIRARNVLGKTDYGQEVARVDMNLGILTYRRGQYQKALHYLEMARNGFGIVTNATSVAMVDLYRSFVYRDLNMHPETIRLATNAENTFEQQTNLWFQALALINQAISHQKQDQYVRAKELFSKARDIFQRQNIPSRILALDLERAYLALRTGRLQSAQDLANDIKSQVDSTIWPSLAARTHLLLAEIALVTTPSQLPVVDQYTQQALALADSHNLHEIKIGAEHLRAQMLERQGNLLVARQTYFTAIERVEWLRRFLAVDGFRLGFMEDKLLIYHNTVHLCHNMATQATNGKPSSLEEMFYTLNLAAAAPLRRLPAHQKGTLAADDYALRQELNRLRERWYWYHSKLEDKSHRERQKALPNQSMLRGQPVSEAEFHQEVRHLEEQIIDQIHRLQALTTEAPLPSEAKESSVKHINQFLADVQASLKPQELLLQYYLVNEQVQALLVSKTTVHLMENISSLAELDKIRSRWHEVITNVRKFGVAENDLGWVKNKRLSGFYRKLIKPIESHLTGYEKIFLVTPTTWHDLPFSAFFDRRRQTYLANRFQLSYLSAPEVLLHTNNQSVTITNSQSESAEALVIGYSYQDKLPQTLKEADQIADLLNEHLHPTLLLEKEATLSNFKKAAQKSRLLHLASHAVFNKDNPLFSRLYLADQYLTIIELYDQITFSQQPLVVLSACETGLGKPRGGGLLGMARGFMVAGANGLIVTLWQVVDDKTAQFMQDFYTALLDHNTSPSAALQYAKQQAIARGDHPYYWAGFIFIQG